MSLHGLLSLFYVIFIAAVFGNNITETDKQGTNTDVTKNVNKSHERLNNSTLTLASEGGLLTNGPDLSLSKENLTSLLALEDEIGKTKEKPSVPRKGVDNNLLPGTNVVHDNSTSVGHNVNKTVTNATNKPKNVTVDKNSNVTTVQPKPEVHKKPLILSYEALASSDTDIRAPVPSSKTVTTNQIPSPNENSIIHKYATKVNSHPGMVMPIVITILVVPMFAIVGYMALRRGQEAWKNRHYKRMDFLLDGMYND